MADHSYGMNRDVINLTPSSVTIGTSTGSTDVEVRVADGSSLTKKDIYRILEIIRDRIVTDQTLYTPL